ncbi:MULTISPECIES: hypothetical protein [unclassified Streptomyces]|uniref:hypothetical protein n=1 Tax=unclassified Streptomyces TaxID=2593676 RepID=UPI002E196436|nr:MULTISPECIES: hypothetical protein [unclassified Streptomyces]
MSRPLPHPRLVLGYRKDGRPIHPILGADERDPSNGQPPVGQGSVRTFTQDEVSQLLAREKQQGGRSAVKEILEQVGFEKAEDLAAFVKAQRDAQAAQLSEVERREQSAAEREQGAAQKIAAAETRERAAARHATLLKLGALGDDLTDAEGCCAPRSRRAPTGRRLRERRRR